MTVATSTSKSGPYAGAGTNGPFTVGFRFLATDHLQVVQADEDGVETVLVLDTDYTVAGVGAGSGSVTLLVALPVGETLTITRDVPFTQEADYVANDAFPAESHERALDLLTMQTQQLNEQVARAAKLPVSSTADADALVADIVLLADNLPTLDTVAGSIDDIQAVAAIAADVTLAAANVVDITNFADVYLGPAAADPTLRADGSALQIGDLYFNTSTSLIRVYASTGWVDSQTPTPVTITRQQFNGTGAQTAFVLSSAPAFLNALFVEISGVSQVPSVDYTLSGTTMTFTSPPPVGVNNILARWFSPITSGVPNDGSVSTAKLADDAVTFAKMQNIATARLLGRATAVAGDVEELTGAQGRSLVGADDAANITTGNLAAARITNALNASGSAPIYACRAWVNFNGTGVVAIRASGNVSSITDLGVGNYAINFTTAMPDANYAAVCGVNGLNSAALTANVCTAMPYSQGTGSFSLQINDSGTARDTILTNVAVFR